MECNGERWHVAPVYVAPVARADLPALCDAWGCEVPTSALVDAIWRAADLKLNPHALMRNFRIAKDIRLCRGVRESEAGDREGGRGLGWTTERRHYPPAPTRTSRSCRVGRTDLYGWHLLSGVPIKEGRDFAQRGLRGLLPGMASRAARGGMHGGGVTYTVHEADVLEALRAMPDNSFHGCLTDPPYGPHHGRRQDWIHGPRVG